MNVTLLVECKRKCKTAQPVCKPRAVLITVSSQVQLIHQTKWSSLIVLHAKLWKGWRNCFFIHLLDLSTKCIYPVLQGSQENQKPSFCEAKHCYHPAPKKVTRRDKTSSIRMFQYRQLQLAVCGIQYVKTLASFSLTDCQQAETKTHLWCL